MGPERERKVQCCSAALATLATLDSGGRNRHSRSSKSLVLYLKVDS